MLKNYIPKNSMIIIVIRMLMIIMDSIHNKYCFYFWCTPILELYTEVN